MADTALSLHFEGCLFSHAEEDALVTALSKGEEDAYEILIQRYQQPVYSLVCRLLNDPSDAPDMVQEVFLKVFRNIGAFRGNSSLKILDLPHRRKRSLQSSALVLPASAAGSGAWVGGRKRELRRHDDGRWPVAV